MDKRASAAEDTRRRIVQATFEVHGEKGIAATTFRDIAQRADVSLATVYRHFPTYDDVVTACGELTASSMPQLDPTTFDGVLSRRARVRILVEGVFARFDFWKDYEGARHDARTILPLRGFLEAAEAETRELIRRALGDDGDEATVTAVLALLDAAVHRILREGGQTPAEVMTDVIVTWLDHRHPAGSGERSA